MLFIITNTRPWNVNTIRHEDYFRLGRICVTVREESINTTSCIEVTTTLLIKTHIYLVTKHIDYTVKEYLVKMNLTCLCTHVRSIKQ